MIETQTTFPITRELKASSSDVGYFNTRLPRQFTLDVNIPLLAPRRDCVLQYRFEICTDLCQQAVGGSRELPESVWIRIRKQVKRREAIVDRGLPRILDTETKGADGALRSLI